MTPAVDTDTQHALFIREVFETISRFDMIQKKEAVLVGVSGGPDSVALVRVLVYLAKSWDLTLGIAHLNHSLRGKESLQDERFVQDLSQELDLPFFSKTLDIRSQAKKEHLSIEEAGRNARYVFFTQTADTRGFSKIATGHHQDDNAEQVLMNLLRGSGPKGLSGIPPVRENRFIRPLIQMPKSRILNFLKAKEHDFVLDSSNTDESYLRNKIRHTLIPLLEEEFNPEIKAGLDRLSHILGQEEDFLTAQATQVFNHCTLEQNKTRVTLSIPRLTQNHPALVNRVLRLAMARVKQNLRQITLTHIQDILALMTLSESGKSLDLPGQIRAYRTRDTLFLQKETQPLREVGRIQKQARQGAANNPKG